MPPVRCAAPVTISILGGPGGGRDLHVSGHNGKNAVKSTKPKCEITGVPLTDLVGRRTPAGVRQRGSSLFLSGAVDVVQGDEVEVRARVRGTRPYSIRLALEDEKLLVSCDCPYFDSQAAVCKHIWATLLAADAKGHLSDAEDLVEAGPLPHAKSGRGLTLVDSSGGEDAFGTEDWLPAASGQNAKADGRNAFTERRADQGLLAEYDDPYMDPVPRAENPTSRWQTQLSGIASYGENRPDSHFVQRLPEGSRLLYVVDANQTRSSGRLTLDVLRSDLKRDGSWGKPKPQTLNAGLIAGLPEASDRQILSMLLGALGQWPGTPGYPGYGWGRGVSGAGLPVPEPVTDAVVPLLCRSTRGLLKTGYSQDDLPQLTWDGGEPWELWLQATEDASGAAFTIDARLQRGKETMPVDRPAVVLASGFVFGDDGVVARLEDFGAFGWVRSIRNSGPLTVPADKIGAFLEEMLGLPALPRVDFPPALMWKEDAVPPRPRLQIRPGRSSGWGRQPDLTGDLSFDYDGALVPRGDLRRGVYRPDRRTFLLRDAEAEKAVVEAMIAQGFRLNRLDEFQLKPGRLPAAVRAFTQAGWHVEAEGKLYRTPGEWSMKVKSGVDWFELNASVDFGDNTAALPQLLAAARRGDRFVPLDDGTMGILPEDWLNKFGPLAGLGASKGKSLRFTRSQAGLLDALLAAQPEVSVDKVFARVRRELAGFEGIEPAEPPDGFCGNLRPYQKDGLGWFRFLEKFSFGGCLADDMGLGKTVQVLALLESRRERAEAEDKPSPSLVVVPKSLVFNWLGEAERFTPKLRLLDHTGTRIPPGVHFEEYDVVLTTYGTLRSDAAAFSGVQFDFCILDEAQAIKNPGTAAAKAARLIKADHRLALSGTPIENHLGELWSLFEFLNPGMLGSARTLKLGSASNGRPGDGTRVLLARALRPFILRRTKDQVAKDLPPKNEQTLLCELKGTQRRHYDQLREHFRRSLLSRVERDGMAKSKIHVLEALLRLRQAACHPGLIDPAKAVEPSAKLEVLMPQLAEVAEEGHKALVFSQFTKFLGIVRDRLDEQGIEYEYLDGRTRDRKARVARFQDDPDCKLFLISLKAGGLGLNLTSAEYVFLLDPWWNPAVEAQAIDRTHRIGQTKSVFAYRIIAAGTVEEKVLELQRSKRDLADSIINADNSLIRSMQPEDLELLLS